MPWEKSARRAVPAVADELMLLSRTAGRTPLAGAQHIAARERAAAIAPYVQPGPVLKDLGLALAPGAAEPGPDTWREALVAAVGARSREQVAREIATVLELADTDADADAGTVPEAADGGDLTASSAGDPAA